MSLEEIFGFLVYFRADESLCRGTALWKEVTESLLTKSEFISLLNLQKYLITQLMSTTCSTLLPSQLCNWLQANEGCFHLTDGDSGSSEELHGETSNRDGASIFSYVQQRLRTFLTVPASSGEIQNKS